MSYALVDPDQVEAGRGPHPAASPFDKRVGEALGVSAFEVYQVDLPPGEETVRTTISTTATRTCTSSCAVPAGSSSTTSPSLRPGHYVAVSLDSTRLMRAGDQGLSFVAICAGP